MNKFSKVSAKILFFLLHFDFVPKSEAFVEIISHSQTQARVIDVGGNIGWYSLLSAAVGAEVDVFEPNRFNYIRACESICMNDWTDDPCTRVGDLATDDSNKEGRIRIFPVGVGSKEEFVAFDTGSKSEHNPGQGKIIRRESLATDESIRLVALDSVAKELGWHKTDIAILKIDVEGFEIDVVRGAKALLESKRVQNIFLEGNVGTNVDARNFKEMVGMLTKSGYRIYKIGGYLGPKNTDVPPEDGNFTDALHYQCKGGVKLRKQCNMWWKLKAAKIDSSSEKWG
jgi:FkbM family methyltransferase